MKPAGDILSSNSRWMGGARNSQRLTNTEYLLKDILFRREDAPYNYDLEEFYNRVSARANLGYPDAVRYSRSVMAVLCRAVSEGKINDVFDKLPDQFKELFGREPDGALSPTRKSSEFSNTAEEKRPNVESHCPY